MVVGRDGRSHVVILGMQVENMGCFSKFNNALDV
jgi:hypothetical protein